MTTSRDTASLSSSYHHISYLRAKANKHHNKKINLFEKQTFYFENARIFNGVDAVDIQTWFDM